MASRRLVRLVEEIDRGSLGANRAVTDPRQCLLASLHCNPMKVDARQLGTEIASPDNKDLDLRDRTAP
jgi:hypothetical protein